MEALDRPHFKRFIASAKDQLAPEAFAAAWAEGRAMRPDEAVEYALEEEEVPPAQPAAGADA